jgi:hypothetical protein
MRDRGTFFRMHMKQVDVSKSIAILANLGVIAGIVFLALELRQNNLLLEAQARAERESVRRTAFTRWIENPEMVGLQVKADRGELLSAEEEFLLERLNSWTLWDWHFIFGERANGLLDESALPVAAWRSIYRTQPSLSDHWEDIKPQFSPEFVAWMEENIVMN